MIRYRKIALPVLATSLCFGNMALAQTQSGTDLGSKTLVELLSTEVTSVSRKPEDPFKAAAAIYVITSEDIRRSGATSIPELLRMVPGLNVAQSSSAEWGISSRGFNNGFANKLLVQIDGRSVYTPLFSGVYWSVQDLVLEDIKQIEVIRGPGATLWGANAVNGVINIITEEAVNTQGNIVSATVGNQDKNMSTFRTGGNVGDNVSYRAYGKYFEKNELRTISDTPAEDDWNMGRAGFRADVELSTDSSLTVQGDVYKGDVGLNMSLPNVPTPIPYSETLVESGGNILARWVKGLDDGSEIQLQGYFDRTRYDYSLLDQYTHTFDVDFQHALAPMSDHEIIWGAGFRSVTDSLRDSFYISFDPDDRTTDLYSAFVQDKIELVPEKLYFTVGSKLEHNDFTGVEYQPSARLAWYPTDNQTVWGSVSRSVRTPSRAEDDIKIIFAEMGGAYIRQEGNRDLESEDIMSYELGYRVTPRDDLSVDISTFVNDYSSLRTVDVGSVYVDGANFIVPLYGNNYGSAETYGFEIYTKWQPITEWELGLGYSFLEMDTDISPVSSDTELVADEGRSPKNQLFVTSKLDLPYNLEFDNAVYYVDNLSTAGAPAYVRFDARLGWKYNNNLSFDLVGQNLLDNLHQEFAAPFYVTDNEIPRAVYGKVTWRF